MEIIDYHINEDLSVDVAGYVDIRSRYLTDIPVQFGEVKGNFNCSLNYLSSLKGSPYSVGYTFFCDNNRLTTLSGAPLTVGIDFCCENNELTSLEHCPKTIGYGLVCTENKLQTLEFLPSSLGNNNIDFSGNKELGVFEKCKSFKEAQKESLRIKAIKDLAFDLHNTLSIKPNGTPKVRV